MVATAGRIMSALGLVTAFGHVSQRCDGSMLITPAADLALVTGDAVVEVDLAAPVLPPGAPAEAWAHLAVYAARPDVAAIARAQPPATFAAAAALTGSAVRATAERAGDRPDAAARTYADQADAAVTLPLLYGQAAWLGEYVHVHPVARLLRSAELAGPAAASLGDSGALLLRGNGALTCGATPGLAVARMWLLAAACQAWLTAAAAGPVMTLTGDEAAAWRGVAGELLPRLWEHLAASVTIPRTRSSIPQRTARG